jgi:hypothetical protein
MPATKEVVVLEDNAKAMQHYEYVSKAFGAPIQEIVSMKNVSFPDLDIQNFIVAMHVAKTYNLDPRVKEIWGWEKGGRITIAVSNAGFLKIARAQPGFIGITANAVYPSDEFEMDMATGKVTKHVIHPEKMQNGEVPLGAYAILRMEGKEPVAKWVYWNEYVQAGDYTPWKKQKSAMISKCATSVLCREAFGLSGIYGEEEVSDKETVVEKAARAKEVVKKLSRSEGTKTIEEVKEEVKEEQTEEQKDAEELPYVRKEYVRKESNRARVGLFLQDKQYYNEPFRNGILAKW